MSGPGRRRKPNPDEEGSSGLPAPPAPPAGYPQQAPAQPEQGYTYDWGQSSADWRQPPNVSPDIQPGPVFDAFSPTAPPQPSPYPAPGSEQPQQTGYYNPVGYGLQDPYSPAAYAPSFPRQTPPPPPPPAPTPPPPPSSPSSPSSDLGGLFEDDLFDTGTPKSAAPAAPPAPATATNPVVPPPPEGAPRPQDGYTAADFAFLEEATGQDVKGWLTFVESRAESRADRMRRFRVRLIGIAAAVAVVALGVGGYVLFSGGSAGSGAPTKSVILLQISDSTGNAIADALLVTDRSATSGTGSAKTVTGRGAAVLIPSQMEINTTGFGLQPFGGKMSQSIPAAGKDTIADTFGVSIDGVWRMDKVTFASLIDEIGGIKLTANTAVPAVTATPTAAAIPTGPGKLTGGQAIAYGTYTANGEAPGAQSERFGQVVAGLLNALPAEPVAITSYLNHLGIVDDPSLPESKLSPILAALSAEQQAGAFTAKVLPVRTDGSNGMDAQAAGPIVSSVLGGALSAGAPGQVSRVLVEDATGSSGIRSQTVRGAAQARLANSGYTFIDGATVAQRSTSVVEVASDGHKDAAVQIAKTLGLQEGSVKVVPGMGTFADVTVVLGADWPQLANVQLPPAGG